MAVPFRRAKFNSECPFCARAIGFGRIIKQDGGGDWMHPVCADASDKGWSWSQLRQERNRTLLARKHQRELQIQIVERAAERGMLATVPDLTREEVF